MLYVDIKYVDKSKINQNNCTAQVFLSNIIYHHYSEIFIEMNTNKTTWKWVLQYLSLPVKRLFTYPSEMFMVSIKLVSIFGQPSLGCEERFQLRRVLLGFSSLNYSGKQLQTIQQILLFLRAKFCTF